MSEFWRFTPCSGVESRFGSVESTAVRAVESQCSESREDFEGNMLAPYRTGDS